MPAWLAPALMSGIPLLGQLLNRGGDEPPQNAAMEQLLRQQSQRMSQADPLYQAILRMAQGLLPRSATQGLMLGQPSRPNTAVPRPGGPLPRV